MLGPAAFACSRVSAVGFKMRAVPQSAISAPSSRPSERSIAIRGSRIAPDGGRTGQLTGLSDRILSGGRSRPTRRDHRCVLRAHDIGGRSSPTKARHARRAFEVKRSVTRVARPDCVRLIGQALNVDRQFGVMLPKLRCSFRDHSGRFAGQSRNLPLSIAPSASFKGKSSLPAAASVSICRSHASSNSTSRSDIRESRISSVAIGAVAQEKSARAQRPPCCWRITC